MSWWLWLLVGLALLLLELVTPGGFFLFFFGAGALLMGLLTFLGIVGPDWAEWLIFAVLSVGSLLLFRKPLQQKVRGKADHDVDSMIGEIAIAMSDIGVQQIGKAELRGSAWTVENTGDTVIVAGQRCRVVAINGLTLLIRG